jgi:hypothetical protein
MLRAAWLHHQTARVTLAHPMLSACTAHHTTASSRLRIFPEAISFNTSFSRLNSETRRLSFAFSCSNSFSRRAWSTFNPPYSLRQRLPVRAATGFGLVALPAFLRDAMVRSDPEKSDEVRGKSRDEILFSCVGNFVGSSVEYRHISFIFHNARIPGGFPKSLGRVGSRPRGFPCFPYSAISMACFSHGKCWINR